MVYGQMGGIVALGLFATSPALMRYSVELHFYASDVCITLLFFSLFRRISRISISHKQIFLYGLLGALGICSSFSAFFVLSGCGLAVIIECLHRKDLKKLNRFLCILGLV